LSQAIAGRSGLGELARRLLNVVCGSGRETTGVRLPREIDTFREGGVER